jgi:phosphohistidine phosphatase
MKTLILMRHAKADPQDLLCKDYDRKLQSRGISEAKNAGRMLLKRKLMIDKLISSPAIRAIQTAEIIRKKLGKNLKSWSIRQGVYSSDSEEIKKMICQTSRTVNSLMLIGHNPVLDEIASLLSNHAYHLKTAEIVLFKFKEDEWSEIFKTEPIKINCLNS